MSICPVTIKQVQSTIARRADGFTTLDDHVSKNVVGLPGAEHVLADAVSSDSDSSVNSGSVVYVDGEVSEAETQTVRVAPHSMFIDTYTPVAYVKIIGTVEEVLQVNALSDIHLVRDNTGNVACMFYKTDGLALSFTPNAYYRIIGKVRWFKKARGIPESHLHVEVDHFSKVDDANEITFHLLDCIYQHGLRLKKLKL